MINADYEWRTQRCVRDGELKTGVRYGPGQYDYFDAGGGTKGEAIAAHIVECVNHPRNEEA